LQANDLDLQDNADALQVEISGSTPANGAAGVTAQDLRWFSGGAR
jgi:hypothetical protein